ncbi:Ribosomal protein L7Ae/L30e/S12e/Gadd45 [Thalictrum thalictroides]|uniref:Ribosomal protein L7Ae/L30e/S12e/Gadd45 n=1 Tax=Thalictrum thalictroides TaxID=46969 RepID=A0A7J6UZ85_THATH|nr:Ribosomal protein L7Ae/L30e/S12e/Gadd45 [Thalictrum thalictroides]
MSMTKSCKSTGEIKQQFSIGVNDVTRVLEQMEPISESGKATQDSTIGCGGCKDSLLQLQAVLLSSNCDPRWLAKHVPSLASSRGVPLIFVKDKKGGSLALGELVKLKTAIVIGIKAKGSGINKLVAEILEKI